MPAFLITALVGVVCIIIGITNMRGNISTLHSYHRHRVTEENRPAFGKLVGLGTIIIGASVTIFGVVSAFIVESASPAIITVCTVMLFIGMAVGFGITFYALKKYNGGIF